jgi:hypothetical protein
MFYQNVLIVQVKNKGGSLFSKEKTPQSKESFIIKGKFRCDPYQMR